MANNNYSFLTVIAVALVVAVVVSLITASITGNVIKVKEKRKGTEVYTTSEVYNKSQINNLLNNINAVSCNKDDVCEVKKTISTPEGSTSDLILTSDSGGVIIDGGVIINGSAAVNGDMYVDTIGNKPFNVNNPLSIISNSNLLLYADGVVTIGGGGTTYIKNLDEDSRSRKAYVCIDSVGKLLRSSTPCV